jgi:hypothetical protein
MTFSWPVSSGDASQPGVNTMRKCCLLLSSLMVGLGATAVQAQGLTPAADALGGPQWQARFERDQRTLWPERGLTALQMPDGQVQRLRLLGDYQFNALRLGDTGGLRLTGGLLINLRSTNGSPALLDANGALPYAGVGYASSAWNGQWGFSADLGLTAQGLGPARIDRLLGLGATEGGLRLQPMLRLGVNLAF